MHITKKRFLPVPRRIELANIDGTSDPLGSCVHALRHGDVSNDGNHTRGNSQQRDGDAPAMRALPARLKELRLAATAALAAGCFAEKSSRDGFFAQAEATSPPDKEASDRLPTAPCRPQATSRNESLDRRDQSWHS